MSAGFALRAPWYVRERENFDLRDPRAVHPTIQMYDSTDFIDRIVRDPGDSLQFGDDDRWSYPMPATSGGPGSGVMRFVKYRLVRTNLRKLYQPVHSRFYLVVVEVFCDQPGLPRAGSHDDISVAMVVRRRHTVVHGPHSVARRLARRLVSTLAEPHPNVQFGPPDIDSDDLLFADMDERSDFIAANADLIAELDARTQEQAWITGPGGGWRSLPPDPVLGALPLEHEEELPMFRLPPRAGCPPDRTRSLWCGLVPTYSADHWTDEAGQVQPKLDDEEIYQVRCVVTEPPAPGMGHCPSLRYASEPTQRFRLAAVADPDGTKNRIVSIKAPDLRRLAARAGQPQGPGGLRLSTPPGSGLGPVEFGSIPGANLGTVGGSASICTFAFELFFIVALFLFLLFLPIVVLLFQLWWMLALRFCLPPTASFTALASFMATNPLADLATIALNANVSADLDDVMGMRKAAVHMTENGSELVGDAQQVHDLVDAMDPAHAVATPTEPPHLQLPPDPLCPAP